MSDDLAARVARLERAEAARTAVAAYCRAVDARDREALVELFAPDAVLHRTDGAHRGRDACLAVYDRFWAGGPDRTLHHLTSVAVQHEPAGAVLVHSYFVAGFVTGASVRVGWGAYADRLVTTESGALMLVEKRIDVHAFSAPTPLPASG